MSYVVIDGYISGIVECCITIVVCNVVDYCYIGVVVVYVSADGVYVGYIAVDVDVDDVSCANTTVVCCVCGHCCCSHLFYV